jgi:cytochrome c553
MMAREQDISETYNPWPKIGWATTAGIVVVSAVLGFGLLDRYQQAGPTLSVWSAICRGLGISSDTESTAEPQPTLRTPTRIAWTNATLDQIKAGDAKHGAFVTLVCTACHGEHGISQSALYPTLAGMDPATVYKQLDDFRSGKRSWGAMNAIAQALSLHDSADAAVYFCRSAGRPAGTNRRSGAGVGPRRSCQTPDICWRPGARYPTLLGVSWSRRVQARSACAARAAS